MEHTIRTVRSDGYRFAPAAPAGKRRPLRRSRRGSSPASRRTVQQTKRKRPVFSREKTGRFLYCCASLSAAGTQALPRRPCGRAVSTQLLKSAITFFRDLSQATMQSSQPSYSMERNPSKSASLMILVMVFRSTSPSPVVAPLSHLPCMDWK